MSSIPPTYAAVTAGTHHPKQQVMGPSNGNNFQPGHQASAGGNSAGGNKSVGKETSTKSILKEIIGALSAQPGKAAELASQLLIRVGPAQACHTKEFMKATPEQQKALMHLARFCSEPNWADMADAYDNVGEEDFNVDISGDSASRSKKKSNFPPEQTSAQDSDSSDSSSNDDDDGSAKSKYDVQRPSEVDKTKGGHGKRQKETIRKKKKKSKKKGKRQKHRKKRKKGKRDSGSSSESSDSESSSEDDNPFSTFTNNTVVIDGQESTSGDRMAATIRNIYSNFAEDVNKPYERKTAENRLKAVMDPNASYDIMIGALIQLQRFAGQALTKCLRKLWSDSQFTRLAQNSEPFNAVARNIREQYDSEVSLIQAEKEYALELTNLQINASSNDWARELISEAQINMQTLTTILNTCWQINTPEDATMQAEAVRSEVQRKLNTEVLGAIAFNRPNLGQICLTIKHNNDPDSQDILIELRNYFTDISSLTRVSASKRKQSAMALPAIPAIQNQLTNTGRYAHANKNPEWQTNEMPGGCDKQISDKAAWAKVNGGRGPGQPRFTKDGRSMTGLSCKLRDIRDKLVAQGVDPTTAWNFAGRHLKGDRWNASKSTKRGASALLDNKETKRQRLFAGMATQLKKYRARYGNLDPKHK